jgi:hypothetical protein
MFNELKEQLDPNSSEDEDLPYAISAPIPIPKK